MIDVLLISSKNSSYLKDKLAASLAARGSQQWNNPSTLQHLVGRAVDQKVSPAIADEEEEWKRVPAECRADLEAACEGAKRFVDASYPLLPGEDVVSDRVSYLLEPYCGHQAGTPTLVRTTTLGVMVHFFDCSVYADGIVRSVPQEPLRPTVHAYPRLMLVEGMIVALLKGFASYIGKELGAKVIKELFPQDDAGMKELLAKIEQSTRTIMREELDTKQIDDLNALLQGIKAYVQQTYLPKKSGGQPADLLIKDLEFLNQKLYTEVMALLVDKRYRRKGLAYLAIGIGIHLSIIQELVIVDPHRSDGGTSSYNETYHTCLNNYITILNAALYESEDYRLTFLGQPEESVLQGAATDRWWFVDHWTGYKSKEYGNTKKGTDFANDAKQKCVNARGDYERDTFRPTIINDLNPFQEYLKDLMSLS